MTPHKDEELEKEVLVKGKLIKEYDNGNVRISFSPDERCPEFPAFEMNIPKEMIVNAAGYIRRDKVGIDEQKILGLLADSFPGCIGCWYNNEPVLDQMAEKIKANAKSIIKIEEER